MITIDQDPDGTAGYEDLRMSVKTLTYEGHDVPIASLAGVIRSKKAAGREKDHLVFPALRAKQRQTKK